MEKLKELYFEYYNGSKEYCNLEQMPEVTEVTDVLMKFLGERLGEDDLCEVTDLIGYVALNNEMQGWVLGYMYAMQMFAACGVKIGDVA